MDPIKSLPRPQASHKVQKIVYMSADISETIKERLLGFRFRSLVRSASWLREHATPTRMPTSRPSL